MNRPGRGEEMRDLLNRGWRKIDSLIDSLFMGRHSADSEYPRIRFFIYVVLISIIFFSAAFLLHVAAISAFRTMLVILAGAGQVVSLVVLKCCANHKIAFRISVFVVLGYCLFLIGVGEPHGAQIFWMLIFPVYTLLLFCGREGLLWTAAGFLCAAYVLFDPNAALATFPYEDETRAQFLITYALLGIVARVFESIIYRAQEDIAKRDKAQLEEAILRLYTEIEDRKKVEKALVDSEKRFRALSEASFAGIALMEGGRIVDLNDQLALLLGYETSDMIGMPLMSCIAPEHRELVNAVMNSAGTERHELLAVRKDGSVFPVGMQQQVTEVGGRSVRVLAIRDISERKKAEAEVKEAKAFAEAVLDSLPGTFFVIGDQLELTRWNRNFEKVSGFSTDELRGKCCLELVDEKDRDAVANRIAEAFAHGAVSLEAKGLTKTGESIPFLFNAVWRTIGDRWYIVGTGMDISDRLRAEESLRRSEELFRLAFETSPDASAITTVERGIFIDVNQSFSELTGYSKEQVLGKSSLDLKIWPDTHVRDEMIRRIATNGVVHNLEVRLRTKEGEVITGLFSGGTLILEDESYILSAVRDITDMRRAEEERLKLEKQVQHAQKLESLGVLAGGIAHDFNNILTSILGNADFGLIRVSPTAPARKNFEEIKKATLRAAGLANQMLTYSGKGRFEVKAVDLSRLVREMAQLLDASISKKALLKYNLADDLPLVECDVNQVQQIVMNLVTNASESLVEESGTIRISTTTMFCDRTYLDTISEGLQPHGEPPPAEGVYVCLEVSDTGCGMDPETQRKVFDPFFTTKFTGRGLGLAVLRGIVCGHKGAVKIDSEIGKGSTFKVLFPAQKDRGNYRIEKFQDGDSLHVWRDGVVLVADDEATVRDIAKEMLEEIRLRVLIASDGNQAVEVFQKNFDKIVCVLLDLTMPGLDSTQVFDEMRLIKPDVKVILSSGYNEQDVTQRFLGKGLAGFIQKPYTLAQLTEKLNSVFRKT